MFSGLALSLALALLPLMYFQELAIAAACVILAAIALAILVFYTWVRRQVPPVRKGTVGIFHPHADAGGGGERVLWCAVQALQQAFPRVKVVLYCREGVGAEALAARAGAQFNLHIAPSFEVVPLLGTAALDASRYPRFTLVRQALGSCRVAMEALRQVAPQVFLDTTGWAAAYPLAAAAGCRVAAYVHYPTISTDMLQRVAARSHSYNNAPDVAGSVLKSTVKLVYYHLFAAAYGLAGAFASVAMVNSSWTRAHISALWLRHRAPPLVPPPCDTAALQALPLDRKLKRLYLVSVAQFRPEKNHELQLEALAAARAAAAEGLPSARGDAVLSARLAVIGGVRNDSDRERLAQLQRLAEALGISSVVDWHVGVSFEELQSLLAGAVGGLHSMVDEHFGISIVEYMAAGVVPIAHNSGGPRADIVLQPPPGSGLPRTGFLCSTVDEYVEAIGKVVAMDQVERMRIAAAARKHAAQYSDDNFKQRFLRALLPLLPAELLPRDLRQL